LPGQEETIECVLAGRDVLSVLPPRGGKTLCYSLPSLLLDGVTVVLDGSASRGRRPFPGPDGIVRIGPDQLYDLATVEMLSRCEVSLLAIEGADRISPWSPRYSPSYYAATRAVELLKPSVTLALCAAAPRDVQGDILYQLGMLDAHRVSAPLALDGFFLQARTFADGSARLDALAALCKRSDARVWVIAGNESQASSLSRGLAERRAFVDGPAGSTGGGTTIVALRDLPAQEPAGASTVIFASHPVSLDAWLTQIGSLPANGPTTIGLHLVESEAPGDWGDATGQVTTQEIADAHKLMAKEAVGGALAMRREDVADLLGMDTAKLDLVLGHLEHLGAVSRRVDPRPQMLSLGLCVDELSPHAIARIEQHLGRLRGHWSNKAREVAEFAQSDRCRRQMLAEASGLSIPQGACQQCDNCNPEGSKARGERAAAPGSTAQPLPRDAEDLVLECVRKLPLGVDKGQLVALLSGTISMAAAEQIDRDDFLGALEILGGTKVRDMVESMVAIGTLIERKLVVADKKVAIVEAAPTRSARGLGTSASPSKTESLRPSAPSMRAIDFDLLTKLREWRNETAHRRQMRPGEVVLDSDLRVIAQVKPLSVQELRDCVGASWQKAKKWAQQILRLVRSDEPGVLPPLPDIVDEPESLESLMVSLNTDDARAKVDAIRALKARGDPRCYGALDRISLDVGEPMLVRLYAGIAKRSVLRGRPPETQAASTPGSPESAEGTAAAGVEGVVQAAGRPQPEGANARAPADAPDFKMKYPT
jgi:superfamily II DNA helicase RecQ